MTETMVEGNEVVMPVAGNPGKIAERINENWRLSKQLAWMCCQDMESETRDLEIVAGYLAVASEDALTLANVMNRPHADLREVRLLVEVLQASRERYRRAVQAWVKRSLG